LRAAFILDFSEAGGDLGRDTENRGRAGGFARREFVAASLAKGIGSLGFGPST